MPSLASLPRAQVIALLSLPLASASLLATYFYTRPLPLTTPREITTTRTLSPSCTAKSTSKSLSIVNPYDHVSDPDSISINLSGSEIRELTDEEILARILKGFFGGWSFLPERTYLSALGLMGRSFIPVGFSGVPDSGPTILSPNDLSMKKLPEKYSKLFHGNFMILDMHIRDHDSTSSFTYAQRISGSFVDVTFGDDRRGFAGFHRLEVLHFEDSEKGGVTLCYSSIACNPTVNKLPLTGWLFTFHRWYGMCLFRDGVEMVLMS
ncbi:hypothetical protein VTL71DRAFT_7575 [Oculimacula yallundae]|uniref:Uncharacterized protein n=1 Tax=Oculimacula yallundae TaxID=86028 RepID=A0ABR4BUI3_9HELO